MKLLIKWIWCLQWALLTVPLGGCDVKRATHDPAIASAAALRFGDVALVHGDATQGYMMASPELQRLAPLETFGATLAEMHRASRPLFLGVSGWRPVPSGDAVEVFLDGHNGAERFYYRLVLKGSASAGYVVSGVYRGGAPYRPPRQQ